MTDVQIEAGTLTASRTDRVVSGVLLPYGQIGRTNLGRFSVPPGTFRIPTDPSVVTLNTDHDSTSPIGRAVTLTDTPAALVATFSVAATPEGDQYLADVEAGRRNALSVEVKDVVIRAGKAVSGALYAAAAVARGAFPSATLLAADVGEELVEQTTTDEQTTYEFTDDTTSPDNAAEAAGEESNVDDDQTAEDTSTDPTDEGELRAALPGTLTKTHTGQKATRTLFATLGNARANEAAVLMAALDNAIAADLLPAQQKQWLAEIWGSRTYKRRFSPLIQSAGLSALKALGWRFIDGKTPEVADYAGFPNQPNSNEVKTESVEITASRLAGAGAVDRAWIDFPSPEFWSAYFREQTNSYERKADAAARDALISGATAVEAGTVPDGVATAAAYIVDGAMAVLDVERDLPSFALVGTDLYRSLLLTRADDMLAFLTSALGLEDGVLESFKIVPTSVATLTGKVLVGTRTAATQFELPGVPVRVDTVNISSGGVERGVYGYHAELVNDAKGLALVAPAVEG